jgi:antirestriction protein ArdC
VWINLQVPSFDAFFNAQSCYATLAHESAWLTRHPSRLDRSFDQQRYVDVGFAKEELVTELGAAFLCANLGLKFEDRNDHAAYIGFGLELHGNDKRASLPPLRMRGGLLITCTACRLALFRLDPSLWL